MINTEPSVIVDNDIAEDSLAKAAAIAQEYMREMNTTIELCEERLYISAFKNRRSRGSPIQRY